VVGTEGRIELRYADGTPFFDASPRELRIYRSGQLIESQPVGPRRAHVTTRFYEDVYRRLSNDPVYLHSARHGRDLLATTLATYLSARTARPVELDETLPTRLHDDSALAHWS
jgi:predicted dehydrogenase